MSATAGLDAGAGAGADPDAGDSGRPQYPFPSRDGIDPDPGYATARATGAPVPVQVAPTRWAWLVTVMDQVRLVHTDHRFSRAAAAEDPAAPTSGLAPPAGSLLSLDPPDHTRVRRLVSGAFSARRMELLRPRVRDIARELLESCPQEDPVDLVAHDARPLSLRVVGELLGVPDDDHATFAGWSDAILSTGADRATAIGPARGALVGYLGDLLTGKTHEPADDLLSHLAAQRAHASHRELVMLAMAVLVAGHETTTNHLASSLQLVLADPELAATMRDRPAVVTDTIEELLRLVSLGSVGGFPRVAVDDVELGGAHIRAGDMVIAALNAANRDPAAFGTPDQLHLPCHDPDPAGPAAAPAAHVAFGAGPHHCLGAALARLVLAEGLTAVLDTRPHAAPDGPDSPHWHRASLIRGLVDLPVRLGPPATDTSTGPDEHGPPPAAGEEH